MNKRLMTALIAAIVVILLLLIFVLPLFTGMVIEHNYLKRLQNRQWLTGVELQEVDYRRHWFHSNVGLKFKITNPSVLKINLWLGIPTSMENTQFTVEQNIDHGPFLFLKTLEGHRNFLFGAALIKSTVHSAFGVLQTISFIRFSGSLFHVINASNIQYSNPDGSIHYSVIGAQGVLKKSADGHDIQGNIHLDQLDLQTTAFVQSVENFQTEYTLSNRNLDLFLGDRKTSINAVTWETSDHQERIRLQSLFLQTQSQAIQDKVDYYLYGFIQNIVTDESVNGPQEIQLKVHGLDLPTVTAFAEEVKQLQSKQEFRLKFTKYPQLLMSLLVKGFQLDLQKLDIHVSEGELTANGQLVLAPAAQQPHNFLELLNYLQIKLHVEISAKVLRSFIQQLMETPSAHQDLSITFIAKRTLIHLLAADNYSTPDAIIQQWVAKRWLIPDPEHEDKYRLDFEYKKHQAILNEFPKEA